MKIAGPLALMGAALMAQGLSACAAYSVGDGSDGVAGRVHLGLVSVTVPSGARGDATVVGTTTVGLWAGSDGQGTGIGAGYRSHFMIAIPERCVAVFLMRDTAQAASLRKELATLLEEGGLCVEDIP